MATLARLSDLELMELQTETLYRHDAAGRLLRVNEPGGAAAPHFFLGRTREGDVRRFRFDMPSALVRGIERILQPEPHATDLRLTPSSLAALREAVTAYVAIEREYAGPAYRFPERVARPDRVTRITAENGALLGDHWSDLLTELPVREPIFAVLRDGAAVSVGCTARAGRRASEASVETLRGSQGHGYAASVTAAWALAIRARGLIPLYSTWWENLASQGVARKLGLILYGVDLHFQ